MHGADFFAKCLPSSRNGLGPIFVRRTFELILPARPHGTPSAKWLRNSLSGEIASGRLTPGSLLPGSRDLARQYRLSRGTVVAAIDELTAEGYLESRAGSGTYVSRVLPEHLLHSHRSSTKRTAGTGRRQKFSDWSARVEPFSYHIRPGNAAFRTNLPALDLFPTKLWARVAARRLRKASSRLLLGCHPLGHWPLRKAVAEYLRTARGVTCSDNQVIIVSGIQEALDLVARLLLNRGDRVLIEDPGYQGAYAVFDAAGARLQSVEIDDDGACPKKGAFRNSRLLYVTPGHQFPMGTTMSHSRRLFLLDCAQKHGTVIFEDDYDGEFRYSGRPLQALQGLDQCDSVIFAGSFNKVLFPSLRLGYMVLPNQMIDAFSSAKAMTSRHHPLLEQAVLCDFINEGHFDRHIRKMRKIYSQRLAVLVESAGLHLAQYLDLSPIEAGMQTVGMLRDGICAEAVAKKAAIQNIDVVPLQRYCRTASVTNGLQIGFAAVDEKQIKAGVLTLARVLKKMASQVSGDRTSGPV